jgi:hypothetical protein
MLILRFRIQRGSLTYRSRPLPGKAALRAVSEGSDCGQGIPLQVADRAARYQSLLAGKRLLVALDNTAAEEQVRPLLPGSGSVMVVVTRRDGLAGCRWRCGCASHGAFLRRSPPEV